ncbi:MAG: hypothetical protein LAO55_23860 [Acidobacteriia bacterium]|nr:hypothetical protein [Terriglobia bacterium]
MYHRFSASANAGIYVGSIDVKPEEQSTQRLLATPSGGAYVPPSGSAPGRLLFMREGTLMEQPFDNRKLELAGEAVPVAEQLGTFLNFAFFSVSANGVLVYRTGASQAVSQLTWLDRQGKRLGSVGDPGLYTFVALSPDQMYAMVTRADGDLWLVDLKRNVTTRFTFGRCRSLNPVWSPDGTQIIFASDRDGGVFNLYRKLASGAKEEELLLKSPDNKLPSSWSHDGRFLLYSAQEPKTGSDVWVLPLDANGSKAGEPKPFLRTEFQERFARFSPDSRWIAYNSNESGRDEIYVRPFSPSLAGGASEGGKWMISRGAGTGPIWLGDGKALVYVASDFNVTAIHGSAELGGGVEEIAGQVPVCGQTGKPELCRKRRLEIVSVITSYRDHPDQAAAVPKGVCGGFVTPRSVSFVE